MAAAQPQNKQWQQNIEAGLDLDIANMHSMHSNRL